MNKIKDLVGLVKGEFALSDEQCQNIIVNIRQEVSDYVRHNNLKSLVIGISGGLDSAVVAALCQERYTGVPLIGLHIPLSTTDAHSEQADWVGNRYCNVYETIGGLEEQLDGSKKYRKIMDTVIGENNSLVNVRDFGGSKQDIRQGNIKARLRMITLYDMARLCNGIVLSTDNYSEYLAGFWTLHGDVGDFGPIQYLYKGLELPYIARALGIREDIITQPPSDGLGVTTCDTDEAQLGCDYETFDAIMVTRSDRGSVAGVKLLTEIADTDDTVITNVVNRNRGTEFKRVGPISLSRELLGLE